MTVSAGTRLGPYVFVAPIGSGGMGDVWKARDERLGRPVAVKVLPSELSSDPERLRRFEQEARSASALTHPNIVTIHDVGSTDGVAWIAMELVAGDSLRSRIAAGPLPMKTLLPIAAQLAEGLARAHSAGIIHRDLKPENVMVTPDGLVKILDFGLAKLEPAAEPGGSQIETVARETKTGVVLGTVGYMSPEQTTGRPVDFSSDQFAFGAILFEMAAGRRAFAGPSAVKALAAIVRDDPPSLETVRPDAPAGLARIVARCLAKNPHDRYGSTADLARDLRDLAAGSPGVLPATATPPAPSRSSRIAIGGLLVLAAAVATWWGTNRRPAIAPAEHSLAVLPFQRVGPEAEEYFSDGITDALTTDLARVRGLLVIARNSAFAYKNRNADLRSVARDLHDR
jgi:serine/threonine protein kinase